MERMYKMIKLRANTVAKEKSDVKENFGSILTADLVEVCTGERRNMKELTTINS